MKKVILTLAILFTISTAFIGCREEKSTGEKIEETMEDAGDEIEDAADDVSDEVEDTADDIEDEMK
ncbi:hypothetical protein [Neotamlana laminarinivorans]|uniref:Uncharacterized protein n=1 Tax=Neotamlana laminarinivorans TaxID=2883124 RepID=A0A9X1HXG1_9FLAO|nr:hypothetical protein [Tamlana laminarinivorans]MCB4797680.1 hypothetical protein [Tamlana laminarinivorans]